MICECDICKRVSYDRFLWQAKTKGQRYASVIMTKCENCKNKEKGGVK